MKLFDNKLGSWREACDKHLARFVKLVILQRRARPVTRRVASSCVVVAALGGDRLGAAAPGL